MKDTIAGKRKTTGARGEEIAAGFLEKQNFRILQRNFRCRCGEVDIIARDGGTLVFVEVKTRRNASYGLPQLAATPFKQRQISKAALTYLSKNSLMKEDARFDVVSVLLLDSSPVIDHIRNAFDLSY